RKAMVSTREMIRNILNNSRFNTDNDLIMGNVDYEIGSIYYKEYLKDNFPREAEFVEDLQEMIRIYNDYYNIIFTGRNKVATETKMLDSGEGSMKDVIGKIDKIIRAKGYIFSYEELSNFYLSLKTKPFLILAGISGTGKSKLVKLFAEAVGATSSNGQYNVI